MKKVTKKKVLTKKVTSTKLVKNSWLKFLAISNVIAFVAVIVVNYLAVNLPIWGLTTGQLADLYPNLFTPAGFTFSIRWLIYLALIGFVVWQMVDLFKKKSLWITKKVDIRFLLSCVANISWIFAWHNQKVFLSVLVMLAFLVILIVIADKVWLGKKLWTWSDKLLVQVPFSLYLGWISVATIANISTWLVNIQRSMRGLSPVLWTMIVIVVASILALIALWKKYNIIFALVVIWAFVWIIFKTLWAEVVYAQIVWLLWICIAVISMGIWLKLDKWLKN